MPRVRLDSLLAERGLFASRSRAAAAVLAGQVHVGAGRARAAKPGQLVAADVELEVDTPAAVRLARRASSSPTRSTRWRSTSPGASALDVGASTGGFTDCLLQRGAAHVVALDVAYGELDWRLRNDERVTVIERANARALDADAAPVRARPDRDRRLVHLARARCCPPCSACAAERFDCLAMVKPQFEVGRERVGKGGVVRDPALRREAIGAVAARGARARRVGARLRAVRASRPGRATARRSPGSPRAGARARSSRRGGGARGGRRMKAASVFTHRRVAETAAAVRELIAAARRAGVVLRFTADETAKHGLRPGDGIELDSRRSTTSTCAS